MKTFEELHTRQKDIAVAFYAMITGNKFIADNIFIQRISTPLFAIGIEISLAFARDASTPNKTKYIEGLNRAKDATVELRTLLSYAKELQYISENDFSMYYNEALDIGKMLAGLVKALKFRK